jgi:hypothetical protein
MKIRDAARTRNTEEYRLCTAIRHSIRVRSVSSAGAP